ncbi:MAG: hypothetical protein GF410_01855 [Chitinivibrionales bacterium]|nr:hypothetical protein [Chitinivibrionales bacterium]
MAKGYPDWFGYSLFPKYGTVTTISVDNVVPVADWTEIVALTGKGQIFGGALDITNLNTNRNAAAEIRVQLDGTTILNTDLRSFYRRWKVFKHRMFPVFFVYLDGREYETIMQIDHDWTYELSYRIDMINNNPFAGAINVYGRLFYYRVV